ncbi:helix-turn-helix transcriptional regulator [Streptomyces sp. PLK6-54]|uniref:Helix-turn-helix transcriptional regulator n=2 Tax=Actinacidiphila acidipaludis TaxID=2873382 RepID=A0ABS7Q3K2_9ACTN|nr:helix-turn-helix transcriptional regulator [Streptomyces acidipaludis]
MPRVEAELHRLAARWLADEGHTSEAAEQAAQAGDGTGTAGVVAVPSVPSVPPAVVEPLSDREREVLRQAAQLQSNADIAAELHISVNTVKSHLKSVHRKLCVNRRRDAVRPARQLMLV